MQKTIYSKMAQQVHVTIAEMRQKAGLTQRELAKRLGREHSFVARIEQGERRVDVVEFYLICKACKASPSKVIGSLYKKFPAEI
jgi:transcriptional regulator with XRE-family HTH domain